MTADYYTITYITYGKSEEDKKKIYLEEERGYFYFDYDSDMENDYDIQKKAFLNVTKIKQLYKNNTWIITSKDKQKFYLKLIAKQNPSFKLEDITFINKEDRREQI